MTLNENLNTVGFKDMHDEQVDAFVLLIQCILHLADGYENPEVFEEAKEIAEDAVVIFGGHGIEVEYEPVF